MNNFWWNRHWTFGAGDGHAGFQAARFFTVSVAAFLFAAGVLELLVTVAGMAELPAQAISIVAGNAAQLRREQDVELPLSRPPAFVAFGAAAPPAHAVELERPASDDVAPPGYTMTANEVTAAAARDDKVREERATHPSLRPTAYTRLPGRWRSLVRR